MTRQLFSSCLFQAETVVTQGLITCKIRVDGRLLTLHMKTLFASSAPLVCGVTT